MSKEVYDILIGCMYAFGTIIVLGIIFSTINSVIVKILKKKHAREEKGEQFVGEIVKLLNNQGYQEWICGYIKQQELGNLKTIRDVLIEGRKQHEHKNEIIGYLNKEISKNREVIEELLCRIAPFERCFPNGIDVCHYCETRILSSDKVQDAEVKCSTCKDNKIKGEFILWKKEDK